jgi:hypothetical protein
MEIAWRSAGQSGPATAAKEQDFPGLRKEEKKPVALSSVIAPGASFPPSYLLFDSSYVL